MTPDSIRLQIVAIQQLVLHEETEPGRVAQLQSQLQQSGIVRNPPIAAPLEEGTFIVLDGATRITALRQLGISAVPVQLVDYPGPQVQVRTWCHFLPGWTLPLFQRVATQAGFTTLLSQWPQAQELLADHTAVACAFDQNGEALVLPPASLCPSLSSALQALVRGYSHPYPFQRVAWEEIQELAQHGIYQDGIYVAFAPFTPEEIRALALRGELLPAGVTRHTIAGRLLRANIPLMLLQSGPAEAKNQLFQRWWHNRLRTHRLRYYPEPTFVFDD
ncbi:MAG: ParB N-terminal domain-containing protein [Chlorobiota bacterium]